MRESPIRYMALFLVLMTSCTYHHWAKPNEIEIRENETVFKLITLDGDTVSFAGSQFVEREPNHLTGVSSDEFIGAGGVYSEGIVSGVDCNGGELIYLEEEISAVEIPNRTAMVGTVSLIIISIPAAIIVLGSLMKNGYESSMF